ncbi:solute-binding protein [Microbacterium thalassium]|nr:solute-binding protein [Microbacterium thalassium]
MLAAGMALAVAVVLSGCAILSTGQESSEAAGRRACGILPGGPDAASRWADLDAPLLRESLSAEGFTVDIRLVPAAEYSSAADDLLSGGCRVLLLTDQDGAGEPVALRAADRGVPVLAYDRPVTAADAAVGFDAGAIGSLAATALTDALTAAEVDPATAVIVTAPGDPSDPRSAEFTRGATETLEAAGAAPSRSLAGVWDEFRTGISFARALSALDGEIDAVWAADDANAAGAIDVLADSGAEGVIVVGQGASLTGLRNILLGRQTATVYTPVALEVDAAAEAAVALARGEEPATAAALDDGTPFIAVQPQIVGVDQVADVVADGGVTVGELCAGDVADACARHGLG